MKMIKLSQYIVFVSADMLEFESKDPEIFYNMHSILFTMLSNDLITWLSKEGVNYYVTNKRAILLPKQFPF